MYDSAMQPYLRQLHFHRTSEHSINSQRRVMELHLVHQDSVAGKRIVLAVFLGNGQTNPALEPIFSHLPTVLQTEPVAMPGISINPGDLLPGNRSYYRYRGSLTTPPCSQGLDCVSVIDSDLFRSASCFCETLPSQ